MAQYIPGSSVTLAASLSALEKLPAPDDTEVQTRLPSICVDYLSHEWEEEDVWASWRNMTRHKNEIANGVRLENASWRTWWKQRNKLSTVSPETLNWLKDSDVTWLYGPLHTAADPVPPAKKSTTEERYNLEPDGLKGTKQRPGPSKPILKHRTLSELLTTRGGSSSALHLQDMDYAAEGDEDEVTAAGTRRARPQLIHSKSDSVAILRRAPSHRRISPPEHDAGTDSPASSTASSNNSQHQHHPHPHPTLPGDGKRHISFNTFVEQCVAFPPVSGSPSPRAGPSFADRMGLDVDMMDEDEYDYAWTAWARGEHDSRQQAHGYGHGHGHGHGGVQYRREEDEEDWDDMLEIKPGRHSHAHVGGAAMPSPDLSNSRPAPSRSNSTASNASAPKTILKIAPTMLKTSGAFPAPSPAVVFAPPPGAHMHGLSGDAQTGPLSPGYRSDGYDLLPIQLQGAAAGRDREPMSERQGRAGYMGGGARARWAAGVGEDVMEEDEEEDGGVGIDYFSGAPVVSRPDFGVGQEYDVAVRRQVMPPAVAGSRSAAAAATATAAAPPPRRHSVTSSNGRERERERRVAGTPTTEAPPTPRSSRSDRAREPGGGGGILKTARGSTSSSSSRGSGTTASGSPPSPASTAASSVVADIPRGRSSTRSPPAVDDRAAGTPTAHARGRAPPSPAAPSSSSSSKPKPRPGPGVTIDTSPTAPSFAHHSSSEGWNSPGSQASSHGFPSPVGEPSSAGSGEVQTSVRHSFSKPSTGASPAPVPTPTQATGGVGLVRTTSTPNVRAGVDETLVGKAVGIVSRGLGALWGADGSGSPGSHATANAERR